MQCEPRPVFDLQKVVTPARSSPKLFNTLSRYLQMFPRLVAKRVGKVPARPTVTHDDKFSFKDEV